jgi:hypothetical protein
MTIVCICLDTMVSMIADVVRLKTDRHEKRRPFAKAYRFLFA